MMVYILILLNTSFDTLYKHGFNIVCVVMLFSSIWSFDLRSEIREASDD